ncbi:hypothetical protein WI60_11085 [Burkholderia cepacia]|nr:hypothetical protein WI49_35005 [Burkholderia cepacia]KVB54768.1 hypothetical protein WI59_07865 [Burkholderia cepacia]KVB58005.1 hypothetical protein WI60_11085 [Burkholderia cepacia]KVB99756.1 hypothetical protein WI65_05860 [Burkholderia cepacia]KVC34332.1 hypothetical protein WI70_28710 [Burkholderia cepacia]
MHGTQAFQFEPDAFVVAIVDVAVERITQLIHAGEPVSLTHSDLGVPKKLSIAEMLRQLLLRDMLWVSLRRFSCRRNTGIRNCQL